MKVLVRINNNIASPKLIKSFKTFDLGEVVTTINDLLDVSVIEITNETIPVLKILNGLTTEHYIVNNLSESISGNQTYYIDDFIKEITSEDLILISTGSSVSSVPYKVYTALLSQTGTNAPVATVLQNTFDNEIVWTRSGIGSYVGTLTGAFINGRTITLPVNCSFDGQQAVMPYANDSAINGHIGFARFSENEINIFVYDSTGGFVEWSTVLGASYEMLVKIEVYNEAAILPPPPIDPIPPAGF